MALITVNGTSIPTPSEYNPYPTQIENSERNANGGLIRDIITVKKKLEMSWNYLTRAQYTQLMAIKLLSSFTCIFDDPTGTGFTTTIMYAGDITAQAFKKDSTTDKITAYVDVSCNFIEL